MDIYNKASCVVIINNDKKVLLIKKNNRYDIPGGKLKYNETYEKAAVREIKEETGLDISRLKLLFSDTVTNCHIKTYITCVYNNKIHTEEDHELIWDDISKIKNTKKEWLEYNINIINNVIDYIQHKLY